MQSRSTKKCFSLIELLVVVAIIGLLAALLLPALSRVRGTAKAVVCASQIRQVWMAVEMYAQDWNGKSPIWHPDHNSKHWRNRVWQYAPNTNVFLCPLIPKGGLSTGNYCNYGINCYISSCFPVDQQSQPLARWRNKPETIALSENADGDYVCEVRSANCPTVSRRDTTPLTFDVSGYSPPNCPFGLVNSRPADWSCEGRWYPPHYGNRATVCFLDGHVQIMGPKEVHATINGIEFYYWLPK